MSSSRTRRYLGACNSGQTGPPRPRVVPAPVLRAESCSVDDVLFNDGWSTGEHRWNQAWWAMGRLQVSARQKPRPRGQNWRWGMVPSPRVARMVGQPHVCDGPCCSVHCDRGADRFSRIQAMNVLSSHENTWQEKKKKPSRA